MINRDLATKTELAIIVRDLKIWSGATAAAAIVVLFSALHFWPPK